MTILDNNISTTLDVGHLLKLLLPKNEVQSEPEVQIGFWTDEFALTAVIALSVLTLLLIAGTIYDWYLLYCQEADVVHFQQEIKTKTKAKAASLFHHVLLSWSFHSTSEELFNTKRHPSDVAVLHVVKVISVSWIIVGHTYLTMFKHPENTFIAFEFFKGWFGGLLHCAELSVSTFFVISGYLVMNGIHKQAENGKHINWSWFYFKRWARLIPVLVFVMYVVEIGLQRHLGSGTLWSQNNSSGNCLKTGHYTLLFLTNFIDSEKTCMARTWYVSCDMQFYMFTPILLWTLYRYKRAGKTAILLLIALCWICNYIIVMDLNFIPNDYFTSRVGEIYNRLKYKPYIHMASYLIGMSSAYIACTKINGQLQMSRTSKMIICCLTLFAMFAISFYYQLRGFGNIGRTEHAIYISSTNIVWPACIGWIIICCTFDGQWQTGLAGKILRASFWLPLSRLTYSTYLISSVVIFSMYENGESFPPPTHRATFCLALGYVVISFLLAFLIYMLIEGPCLLMLKAWEKHMLTKSNTTR